MSETICLSTTRDLMLQERVLVVYDLNNVEPIITLPSDVYLITWLIPSPRFTDSYAG